MGTGYRYLVLQLALSLLGQNFPSYGPCEPRRERGAARVSAPLLYFVVTTDNTPGAQKLLGRNDQRLSLVHARLEAGALPQNSTRHRLWCDGPLPDRGERVDDGRNAAGSSHLPTKSGVLGASVSSIHWKRALKKKLTINLWACVNRVLSPPQGRSGLLVSTNFHVHYAHPSSKERLGHYLVSEIWNERPDYDQRSRCCTCLDLFYSFLDWNSFECD